MKKLLFALALLSVPLADWCQAPASGNAASAKTKQVSPFAGYVGDWVGVLDGKVWLLLELETHGDQLTGWLTHSRDIEMNDEGGLRSASEEKVREAITDAVVNPDGLFITVRYADANESDHYVMKLTAAGDAAELKMAGMNMPPGMPKPKPWTLTKFPGSNQPKAH
jgi:hypothetical protein